MTGGTGVPGKSGSAGVPNAGAVCGGGLRVAAARRPNPLAAVVPEGAPAAVAATIAAPPAPACPTAAAAVAKPSAAAVIPAARAAAARGAAAAGAATAPGPHVPKFRVPAAGGRRTTAPGPHVPRFLVPAAEGRRTSCCRPNLRRPRKVRPKRPAETRAPRAGRGRRPGWPGTLPPLLPQRPPHHRPPTGRGAWKSRPQQPALRLPSSRRGFGANQAPIRQSQGQPGPGQMRRPRRKLKQSVGSQARPGPPWPDPWRQQQPKKTNRKDQDPGHPGTSAL